MILADVPCRTTNNNILFSPHHEATQRLTKKYASATMTVLSGERVVFLLKTLTNGCLWGRANEKTKSD